MNDHPEEKELKELHESYTPPPPPPKPAPNPKPTPEKSSPQEPKKSGK